MITASDHVNAWTGTWPWLVLEVVLVLALEPLVLASTELTQMFCNTASLIHGSVASHIPSR